MGNRTVPMKSRAKVWLVVLLLIGFSWGVYQFRYWLSQWSDYRERPWAYSRDEQAQLLTDHWEGQFTDPDGVVKTISLTIDPPVTEAERSSKATRRNRRGGGLRHEDKRAFDGHALVKSKLGIERYEIYGHVLADDFYRLDINFRPEDEVKRVLPNFILLHAEQGVWSAENLWLTLNFSYLRKDGSSFSSSADPRFDKKVTTSLKRSPDSEAP